MSSEECLALVIISVIVLFAIIYFAVRLAIKPLLYRKEESNTDKLYSDLIKLRDMNVLDNNELEEIIEFYEKRNQTKDDNDQYQEYVKILNELKEMEYFTDDQSNVRMDKLKAYLKAKKGSF